MRKICLLILLGILCSIMTSCYDRREIDDMAYVIAIGLDKGNSNHLKMTLQFAVPTKSSSGDNGGGGGGNSSPTSITTIETPTIYAGINMINTYVSKQVNFSHAKIVVFSEELAREGIHEYIYAMVRGREFRGNMHVAVAKGSAEEYITNVKPTLEPSIAKYFETNLDAYKYTGFTANTQLINFYLFEECTCRQAYATLVGVNKYEKSSEFKKEDSTYKEKGRDHPFEGDFYAGNLPKTYDIKSETMGLAVFDGGKMVGILDGEETSHLLMVYGTFEHAYVSVPDPLKENSFVVMDLRQKIKPYQHSELINGKPQITSKVFLEGDIVSVQSGINYESPEKMKTLENAAEEFHEKGIKQFLEKTRELGVDAAGFGRNLKMRYILWDDWQKVHWLDKYKDATFNVEVDINIRRPGLMIRSAPAKATEGDVMD